LKAGHELLRLLPIPGQGLPTPGHSSRDDRTFKPIRRVRSRSADGRSEHRHQHHHHNHHQNHHQQQQQHFHYYHQQQQQQQQQQHQQHHQNVVNHHQQLNHSVENGLQQSVGDHKQHVEQSLQTQTDMRKASNDVISSEVLVDVIDDITSYGDVMKSSEVRADPKANEAAFKRNNSGPTFRRRNSMPLLTGNNSALPVQELKPLTVSLKQKQTSTAKIQTSNSAQETNCASAGNFTQSVTVAQESRSGESVCSRSDVSFVVETVRTVKNILDHWRIESIIL
jgi:hypothetical protein